MPTLPVCPACGKTAQVESAAFCPFCGAALSVPAKVDESVRACLDKVSKQSDPKKKHELLLKAREEHPDSLEIEQELLFLGRLYERNPKTLDFSVIKCYLLNLYLEPKDFSEDKRDEMRRELFHHPQLERCQALAPDADMFTRNYLERLSREFIDLFLLGSNAYMHSVFGFRMDSRAPKLLAAPTAAMISRVRSDMALEPQERSMLSGALYAAFEKSMSDTHWLQEALASMGEEE